MIWCPIPDTGALGHEEVLGLVDSIIDGVRRPFAVA
jgi:hypothetical protein